LKTALLAWVLTSLDDAHRGVDLATADPFRSGCPHYTRRQHGQRDPDRNDPPHIPTTLHGSQRLGCSQSE
jgi:hypothetical protein